MKKLFFSLAAFIIAATTVKAQETVIADANAKVRPLSGSFTGISVSSGVELYLVQGNEESLAVSISDEKYAERFKTEIVDGTLKIWFDQKGFNWNNDRKRKLKAYVSFKTLEKLYGSAGASVKARGTIDVNNLVMRFNSGATFDGRITAKELDIDQDSGSDIDMTGRAGKLTIDISSGAMFEGFDMEVDYCDAKATSGASVRIGVNKELTGKANSGGSVRYKGAAVIRDISVSSGGIIKKA